MSRWDRVPAELKVLDRWVLWRYKHIPETDRWTKVPVCAATGREAKSTDEATWCSFEKAVASVGKSGTKGIGLVFGPDKAYTGLDLDHVLHDGVLEPEYRWVVDEADTYTEVSPSGDGLHLYFRGSKPADGRCRRGDVEMYDHGRFFTVTGTPFGEAKPVAARPEVLERAYRMWLEPECEQAQPTLADAMRAPSAKGPGDRGGCGGADAVDDDELVRRMRASRSGAEIAALLDGDMSAQRNDHSAADLALCNHLAFWCGGDAAQMDRIFRSSGLMRGKWDSRRGSSTYGEQTVARALQQTTEFYKPRGKRGGGTAGGNGGSRAVAVANTNACSNVEPGGSVKGSSNGVAAEVPAAATGDVESAPVVAGWTITKNGRLHICDADGTVRRYVTSTPPWVACDLEDVDTGDVRALVRMRVKGRMVERAIDRDVLMNQARVLGALGPMGANASTENAKDLVRYLTDCERQLGDSRPCRKSVTHLGWADGPLGAFMPYDHGGEGMRFVPAADNAVKAKPFMEPKGTLAEWVAGMAPAREASMAFRCVLAASFASPLVSIVDVQTFIVYLWGRSRSGKTPTLKAAGSVWGDPSEGAEGYFRTFADTPKSIIRAATLLHDMPVLIDELQSKGSSAGGQAGKRMAVEDLLYSLSIGHERGALNSDRSMMRTGSWRSLTIATGEIPIVGDSTQQGAANRTLELNAEPFGDSRAAQLMHRLVKEQHGTAGRAFVDALRRNDRSGLCGQFAAVRDGVDALAAGHPQADNVALVAFADALAEYYVFSPGRAWDECLNGAMGLAAWALGASTGREGADTDLKAMQFVAEWLVRNRIHFDEGCEMDRLERYGSCEARPGSRGEGGGTMWNVFSTVLERALADAGYDRQKTLRRMADEGVLDVAGSGGFTRQRRIGGNRIYCVCIDQVALEAVLERSTDAACVSVSCEGAPC